MTVRITYFVHGTTTDNEQNRATGWLPGELSVVGKQQAAELGRLVADKKFDVVFCSDLTRAVDSAERAFGGRFPIIQDPRVRECNYGDFNGAEFTFKDNLTQYIEHPFPNGECYRDVETRMADFLAYLKEQYGSKHIAIVAHQAPQLALDVLLKGKTWGNAFAEDWRNTKAWQPGWEYVLG